MNIPFSLLPNKVLGRKSDIFIGIGEILQHIFPFLELNLKRADFDLIPRKYISMCLLSSLINFILLLAIGTFALFVFDFENYYIWGPVGSLIISFLIFLQQVFYPKVFANRRIRSVERNLLSALRSILIQMNSGVPMFDILVSISSGNYEEVSKVFTKAVRQINSGINQVDALEEMAENNPSLYFRRAIWQIANGMRAGADISIVLKEVIDALSEEQLVQIQNYGSRLNPLAMFYMLVGVILPALSITFVIIISAFAGLNESGTKGIFLGLFVFSVFVQVVFLGMIKSRRPNLLSG
ncbi:type II secretion system F family protein [Candidatus Woesearchaeota archaeon]|nr:type II secretion system F family protein [Candidatus Woesearchaeota archaeon]